MRRKAGLTEEQIKGLFRDKLREIGIHLPLEGEAPPSEPVLSTSRNAGGVSFQTLQENLDSYGAVVNALKLECDRRGLSDTKAKPSGLEAEREALRVVQKMDNRELEAAVRWYFGLEVLSNFILSPLSRQQTIGFHLALNELGSIQNEHQRRVVN